MPKQTDFDFGDEKIRPSDLRALAYVLIATNRMPSLTAVLDAVASTREKFLPLIEAARRADDADNLKA
jgi:hypothetical protein